MVEHNDTTKKVNFTIDFTFTKVIIFSITDSTYHLINIF